jgi:preprotein translocase subunit SecG
MYTLLVIIHVIICLILCVVVLLQSSKGGGLAGAFGGAGGMPQQILGTRGMTTLLHKLTIYFGVAFFLSSFTLFVSTGDRSGRPGSIVSDAAREGTLTSEVTAEPFTGEDPLELPATPPAGDEATGEATSGSGQSSEDEQQRDPE